jgi:hypothetical protein
MQRRFGLEDIDHIQGIGKRWRSWLDFGVRI